VSFEWKSKAISEPYHQQYTDWLTRHVFSKLTPGTCVRGCREHKQKKRRQDGRSVRAPNLYLVPVESIDEPISAIPNIGGDPGDFIFVRPVDTWSDCFSDYIAMCHGSLE
jgi:hypothetical protein